MYRQVIGGSLVFLKRIDYYIYICDKKMERVLKGFDI